MSKIKVRMPDDTVLTPRADDLLRMAVDVAHDELLAEFKKACLRAHDGSPGLVTLLASGQWGGLEFTFSITQVLDSLEASASSPEGCDQHTNLSAWAQHLERQAKRIRKAAAEYAQEPSTEP